MLLLIIFFSPWVESLFTHKPTRLYVEGAPISEYKLVCLYAREYGMFVATVLLGKYQHVRTM